MTRILSEYNVIKIASKYLDIQFLSKFFLIFLPLYFFSGIYLGVVSPGGTVYIPVLAHHLNYIDWISKSIIYTANFIDQSFGLNTYVRISLAAEGLLYQIKIDHGASVTVWLECLGLGLASFWVAYIFAHDASNRKKITWCLTGIFIIWFINCWRIAILLLALQHKWQVNRFMEHHAMFNCIAYGIMFMLIYFFNKNGKIQHTLTTAGSASAYPLPKPV